MAENTSGGADAPTATATPAVAPNTTTTTATAPVVPATEPAAPSKGDWAGFQKTLREQTERMNTISAALEKLANPAPAKTETKPADAGELAQQLADLNMRLGIRDALAASGITDPKMAARAERLAKAERPTDLAAFVAGFVADFAPHVTPPVVAAVTPPTAPSNTGAPAAAPSTNSVLDANPFKWPPEVHRNLKDGEFHEAVQKWQRSQGMGNPFAAMRANAESARKPR